MRRKCLLVALIAVFVVIAATILASPPQPASINIVSPDPSLPAELKALSGKWVGQWTSGICAYPWDCVLYVENIGKDTAQVVHSWGRFDHARQCHCAPDYMRISNVKVSYANGEATLEFVANYRTHLNEVRNKMDDSGVKRGSHVTLTLDNKQPGVIKGYMLTAHLHEFFATLKKAN